ncbi:hypothetical protein HGRIS_005232 [Hohenbuehelia grisea]|uniref:Carboxylic ester hydrolase n=1 Tax=Hohenbuehelia grisea TaxID=104357 RepID=A0ABR3JG08_9AGAR
MAAIHLHDELKDSARVSVETRFGKLTGGRASNGAAVFLEVPYALPPARFEDPRPLPLDFRYDPKEYISESTYAAQPMNDGQARDMPFKDKVGLGDPSENPLSVNIVAPPAFPSGNKFPVKVYIHGGFLQFGSPHSLGSQAQYVAAERSEVWINIGYRLSAFGFLACDEPRLDGNYGFKDQWLALEWIKANVDAFGGDANDIQLTGLSAGAHSVHQILHHASRLPQGQHAPFHSAVLQSNAILTRPKSPLELRAQYQSLCRALGLDPEAPETLTTLKDPSSTPRDTITHAIETDALGTEYGTFRGCMDGQWMLESPDPMTWQRDGGLARGLRDKGVRSIVIGDLLEEWYLYSIAHPIPTPKDIVPNLERYFAPDLVQRMVELHRRIPEGAPEKEAAKLFGEILSNLQVHLPVRIFARDLAKAGFPVLRYEIRWTPEQLRPEGYVTHGSDRPLWAFRTPVLNDEQVATTRRWIDRVDEETKALEEGKSLGYCPEKVLTLREDQSIDWCDDNRWSDLMKLLDALPVEDL